jgi:hypothetical protein
MIKNSGSTKNGFVLIGIYGFETEVIGKIQKCDLMETYTDSELKRLMVKEPEVCARQFIERVINQQMSTSTSSEHQQEMKQTDSGFDFLTDDQIKQKEELMETMKEFSCVTAASAAFMDDGMINFDEI